MERKKKGPDKPKENIERQEDLAMPEDEQRMQKAEDIDHGWAEGHEKDDEGGVAEFEENENPEQRGREAA